MAYGDLIGDLSQAYMTNAQRAAKNGVQSLTGGPIARASAAVPVAGGLAGAAMLPQQQQAAQPAGLATALTNPTQFSRPPQPSGPASLESARPVGVIPTANSPTYPTTAQVEGPKTLADLSQTISAPQTVGAPGIQPPADLASAGNGISLSTLPPPVANATPINDTRSLDSAYRQTGIGSGTNQIAGRVGADGVPEFTNAPADLRSAGGLPPINTMATPAAQSLSDAYRSDAPSSGPQFAALGSAANLGDGVGSFSQSQAGDSQLALTRFQRAIDLRDAYKAQDRLGQAQGAQYIANNTNIVHDSSKPYTRDDKERDLATAFGRQRADANVAGRQQSLEDLRTGQVAAAQTRQTQRLEDVMTAAQSPTATPDQLAAARRITDPDGTKGATLQLTQAKTAEANAAAQKSTAEATGTAPEVAQKVEAAKNKAEIDRLEIERRKSELKGTAPGADLKKAEAENKAELDRLEIERRKTVAAQTAKDIADKKSGAIDIAKEARDLAIGIAKDDRFGDITGPINSRLPTTNQGSQDLINRANRLQSLLTLENLPKMSGVLTDKDIEFLARIGSGLNVTEGGIMGGEEGTKKRINDIATNLSKKITDYEKANPAKPVAAAPAAQPGAPAVGAIEDGHVFLGGDPSSPSSWRAQ